MCMNINVCIYTNINFRYSMMLECWQRDPTNRPSFTALRTQLEIMMESYCDAEYMTFDLDETRDYYQVQDTSGDEVSLDEDDDNDEVFVFDAEPKSSSKVTIAGDSGVSERGSGGCQPTPNSTPGSSPQFWDSQDSFMRPHHPLPSMCIADERLEHSSPAVIITTKTSVPQQSNQWRHVIGTPPRKEKKKDHSTSFPVLYRPKQKESEIVCISSDDHLLPTSGSSTSTDSGGHCWVSHTGI